MKVKVTVYTQYRKFDFDTEFNLVVSSVYLEPSDKCQVIFVSSQEIEIDISQCFIRLEDI